MQSEAFDKLTNQFGNKRRTNGSPLEHFFKGTGTRDLIWLKVVSLDRSWLVALTDDVKKNFKCCFLFLIIFLKSLVVLEKII